MLLRNCRYNLFFYFVAYIACGRRFVVASFRLFQNGITANNLKAVCESVNNKVPVTICFEISYPGLSVKWGYDCLCLLEVTLWLLLDVRAVGDPGCNLAPSKHAKIGSLASGIRFGN